MPAPALARRLGPVELIVLDFDGVVADSELLSNTLLAEFLTREGLPTTLEQAMARYMGRRSADNQVRIRSDFGRPLPADFFDRLQTFTRGRMRNEVVAVPGIAALLAANPAARFCVASSSSREWLDHGVDKFGLRPHLGQNLFSGTEVKMGKPAPDIFLHAAERMGTKPELCAVVEDSPAGIQGAAAARMMAIGFLGAAHVRDGHGEQLLSAGAHALASDHRDVARLLGLAPPLT